MGKLMVAIFEQRQAKYIVPLICMCLLLLFAASKTEAAPILKLNSQGHDVVVLQQNLVRLNYGISKISGNYDKETQEAVKSFQKKNKLAVTGIVNRETWWAIKGGKSPISTTRPKYKPSDPIINDNLQWDNLSSVPYGTEFLSKKEVNSIIATAKNHMGVPYVWGGNTPNEGFDCSGYLEYVFAQNGIRIPRTADVQYNLGRLVKPSQLEVGDLVFFTTYEPGASHCGIYLGNGNFIHASTTRGVGIDNLDNAYWSARYYGGKHIVK